MPGPKNNKMTKIDHSNTANEKLQYRGENNTTKSSTELCSGFINKCTNTKDSKYELCTVCWKTKNIYERRCPNFSTCKGYRTWNSNDGTYYDTCSKCHKLEQSSDRVCPNFEICGGYRGFNHQSNERYPVCFKCTHDDERKCPYYDECTGKRQWNHTTQAYYDTCYNCYKYDQQNNVEDVEDEEDHDVTDAQKHVEENTHCPNFEDCGGYRGWDRENKTRFLLCLTCTKRCPRYDRCKGLRSWDKYNNCLYPKCRNCS